MLNWKKYIPFSNYWICQICGWLAFSANSIYINNLKELPDFYQTWKLTIAYIIIIISGFLLTHQYRNWVVKKRWYELSLIRLIPRVAISILLFSLILTFLEIFMDWFIIPEKFWNQNPGYLYWTNGSVYLILWSRYMIIWFSFYHIYHYARQAILSENKRLNLEHAQKIFELNQLRSQLNPHFLFNALNSIRSLTISKPELARESINRLSDLLRASLNAHKKQWVSLREELHIIQDYINIEKIRFEERLQFSISVEESLLDIPVPSMMIQTLVENAVKHGINQRIEGGTIQIYAFEKNNQINILIENPGAIKEVSASEHKGVGLMNTQRRLDLLYNENAFFSLNMNEKGMIETKLILPITPNSHFQNHLNRNDD